MLSIVQQLDLPVCYNSTFSSDSTSTAQEPVEADFVLVELVKDNLDRSASDLDFKYDYANEADTLLGKSAPANSYIASTLGQETLLVNAETGLWQTRYAPSEILNLAGQWTVYVSKCVDRREEALGKLDCATS